LGTFVVDVEVGAVHGDDRVRPAVAVAGVLV
jgi:hypothetical protein